VENHLGDDCRQTGKLAWRQGWKIRLATTAPELENYHGGRQAGTLPAKRGGTYVSFDKIDDGIVASDKLQIPYRPDYRVSGNSLDIIDKMKIPNGKWGTADYPEPLTKDYKIYGPGKATQVIVDGPIPVDPGTITKL